LFTRGRFLSPGRTAAVGRAWRRCAPSKLGHSAPWLKPVFDRSDRVDPTGCRRQSKEVSGSTPSMTRMESQASAPAAWLRENTSRRVCMRTLLSRPHCRRGCDALHGATGRHAREHLGRRTACNVAHITAPGRSGCSGASVP